ncbi:MAG: VWA domain-containing protein [Myxococcales bacterium]|nr:VWA domain-containing protein [Myxococcales bacterium]
MDQVLEGLYDAERTAGRGRSAPYVAKWLGDIRRFFPSSTVQVMQKDAVERLGLTQLLLEPELLASVQPDLDLVCTLVSLNRSIPERSRDQARHVVRRVAEELMKRLREPMREAVRGSIDRSVRNLRPRYNEVDWHRTIRANLRNWLPEQNTLVVDRLIGHGRRQSSLKDVILCVDQSGSMMASVVYAAVFGAVLASLPALRTRVVVFDTEVVDLTEVCDDPVDLLFGTQLGGGTDIARALGYCRNTVVRPHDTIMVMITDLYEGGDRSRMLRHCRELVASGVNLICLLALDDRGTPSYDRSNAAALAAMGVPSFACTPDLFPSLMGAALSRQDLSQWASRHDIATG